MVNGNFQTQSLLYSAVIVLAVATGTLAGIGLFGSGLNATGTMIIFISVALSTLYLVLSLLNLDILFSLPYFALVYTVTTISFTLGLILAVRSTT